MLPTGVYYQLLSCYLSDGRFVVAHHLPNKLDKHVVLLSSFIHSAYSSAVQPIALAGLTG